MPVIYSKWPYNVPTLSIPRPSKIYPKWDFWFENKPSGNPDAGWLGVIFERTNNFLGAMALLVNKDAHAFHNK
jgi:hypothetical protein